MNYYEHHLGDYAKDTGHLSMLEHGAYRILLDRYYSTEAGIPEQQVYRMARARSEDEKAAVDAVLEEFFNLADGVWRNRRADEELEKASNRINAARENGKKGGRPPRNQDGTNEKPSGFSVGSENETQAKAHQTPLPIHQAPIGVVVAREDGEPDPPDTFATRRGQLSCRLRGMGVTVTSTDPHLCGWVDANVTDAEVDEAVALAREQKPMPAKVPAAYLATIISHLVAGRNVTPIRPATGPPAKKTNGYKSVEQQNREAAVRAKALLFGDKDNVIEGEVIHG